MAAPDADGNWRRRRPRRASTYFLVLVAGTALVGSLYLRSTRGSEEALAAAFDLPRYHQITQSDIRTVTVAKGTSDGLTRNRNDLLGHYTVDQVHQDRPLSPSDLGPRLPSGALAADRTVALLTSTTTIGAVAGRGDRVDLVFAADGLTLDDVRILDVRPAEHAETGVVILALPRRLVGVLARLEHPERVAVVRDRAYEDE
jgi:SAF domain-containing protein